jgi:leucyl aminopeptidase
VKIEVLSHAPAAKPGQLVALIDLKDRALYDAQAAARRPGWADLERRRKTGEIKKDYLAVDQPPLLWLPAAAAPHWGADEQTRILAARAFDAAVARGDATLVIELDGPDGGAAAPLAAEGIALQAYRFAVYKPSLAEAAAKDPAVALVVPAPALKAARAAVEKALARVASANRARDLINEPGSVATPAELERRARAVAKANGLKIDVLLPAELNKQGYGGLVAVGKGGAVPPRMIVLSYVPKGKGSAKNAPHLGLLGKGITFDTGGISLKPGDKMWEMKGDMSGAAAVLHAIEIVAQEKLPIRVTAVICAAQNYPDANATMPGDVFRAKNGKTVHVDNTDAEGRLVLTDGLARMGEEKVTHLVDVATLTGACVRALGNAVSGAFGNDAFADLVVDVAGGQGEPCWRLPIVEEYRPWIDSEIADVNNMSSVPGQAGATVAALFLREFVPEGVHWTHLDIAGTFLAAKQWKYYRPGATGVMTRSLAALAEKMATGA